jgi:hypothetical protein
MLPGFDAVRQGAIQQGTVRSAGGLAGPLVVWWGVTPERGGAGRSRWQEWTITLSIIALVVIGVAAIWGQPIRRWLGDLGGDARESGPSQSSSPAGPSL